MEQILKHTRGDTFIRNVLFKRDWVAIDLTGSTVTFSLKDKATNTAYIVNQAATIATPVNWTAKIQVSAATMRLDVGEYVYDIQITDSLWVVTTPMKGKFLITYDVT